VRVSFFDPPDDEDASPEEQESRQRIEAGGIPVEAERRLRSLVAWGGSFTSTLSVGEFALLSKLGPAPLAQVMGASVHQVGWQYLPIEGRWGGEVYCELDRVMHAWDQARRRALDRLTEEARLVGADAVLGVRLRRGEHDWARGAVDYLVTGTAVRLSASAEPSWPILSDLSVQDYWKLSEAGWGPVGLVAATSVFFVSQSTGTQWKRRLTAARNQELTEFSRGFYAARETAVRYLQSQASAARASGIVGMQLEHQTSREKFKVAVPYIAQGIGVGSQSPAGGKDERAGIAITIHAAGTAIRRESRAPRFPPETVLGVAASR
jgi:uncharacterized protein YbjQ (UPF0145 family)